MQHIQDNIYRIPVPLPNNPLRELNAYLIRGERDLLIDTGFDLDACEKIIINSLAELNIKRDKLDIFITHFHSDHVGLLHRLVTPKTRVWCGKIPWDILAVEDPNRWQKRFQALRSFGLCQIDEQWNPQNKPEFSVNWSKVKNFSVVKEGQVIEVGGLRLKCIETDGHFPGHICLYEPKLKILFAGDHILDKISPNVACYNLDNSSSLAQYLQSLDKVAKMDIKLVLPGHRNFLTDVQRRVTELKIHHQERLAEVERIITHKGQTGVEIASQMKWDLSYPAWEKFPPTQKFFALGEAMAHINYLVEKGSIRVVNRCGILYFSKVVKKINTEYF
ncbi:MAG: MBL fold metallo-hydrolase [Desulfitobacteriia bacterium]|jgi:glyoxylase-like metal-dependent hydrolase (beta-lactamase superfamily II)